MGFKGRRLCVAYCCRGVVIESTRCAAVISAIPRTYLGVPQEINAFVYVPACMYVDGYRLQPFPRAPATSCPCTYVPSCTSTLAPLAPLASHPYYTLHSNGLATGNTWLHPVSHPTTGCVCVYTIPVKYLSVQNFSLLVSTHYSSIHKSDDGVRKR